MKLNLVKERYLKAGYHRTLQHICQAHKTNCTKANLAKDLQLPTYGTQSFYSGRQQSKQGEKKSCLRRFAVCFLKWQIYSQSKTPKPTHHLQSTNLLVHLYH